MLAHRRMPEEVRAIRAPWRSLTGVVPHLTAQLEREFRFGQRVTVTERGFLLGGTIKGGSSSMWFPASREAYEAYLGWRAIEGRWEGADPTAYERLAALCDLNGVALMDGDLRKEAPSRFRPELAGAYELLLAILRELPPAHLARAELAGIRLGGWGPDAAKASAYHEGAVHLYDFALRGARRTFAGLFLHELGHAHERALAARRLAVLAGAYERIVAAEALFGAEFLLDAAARRSYQRLSFGEFMAELYLAYTACGAALRDFAAAAPHAAREAWAAVLDIFRESFFGFEYV